jgi:hypothetical protein
MSNTEKLAAMRGLGVVWKKGRLPFYPHRMNAALKAQADALYDSMSDDFVDQQCTKPKPKQQHLVAA